MGALAGRLGRVKLCASTPVKSTGEAATLAAGGLALSIDTRARRHWDRALTSTPVVLSASGTSTGVAISSSNYAVDYAAGTVTFATARSTAQVYTLDVNYLTASYLGVTHGWTLDADVNMLENTAFSTTTGATRWRTFTPGLGGGTVSLNRFVQESTASPFYDLQNAESDLVLELLPSATAGAYQCSGRVERVGFDTPVDGMPEETVDIRVDGPLSFTTNL